MAAVLTRTGVQFLRQNKVVGEISLLNATGQSLLEGNYLMGRKVQPMIYSTDLSKLYIGGLGKIYVIDTVSQELVHTMELPAGPRSISSLAVSGDLLLIGETGEGGGARLLATSTNPASARYHGGKDQKGWITLKNTDVEQSAHGVSGINDYNHGLGALRITRDPSSGQLQSASIESLDLSQPNNLVHVDRTNISNAQSAVLVRYEDVEYAINQTNSAGYINARDELTGDDSEKETTATALFANLLDSVFIGKDDNQFYNIRCVVVPAKPLGPA